MNYRSGVETLNDVKTEEILLLQDKLGGYLFIGQVASGIEVA